jgi:hypothetical protein
VEELLLLLLIAVELSHLTHKVLLTQQFAQFLGRDCLLSLMWKGWLPRNPVAERGVLLTLPAWLSGALHGHFVDLYSAFKVGIRNLSVLDKEKQCLVVFVKGDDAVEEYMESLNNLLCSDMKKYNSKKWWSHGVVELPSQCI